MQAVIASGGKQYIVSQGDKIQVDRLASEPGSEISFDQVLMINSDSPVVGTPYISGARVLGKVISEDKGEKVFSFKYKRRKGYHKIKGHRQQYTTIEIQNIQAS